MKAAAHGKIRRKKAFKYKCPFIIYRQAMLKCWKFYNSNIHQQTYFLAKFYYNKLSVNFVKFLQIFKIFNG